MTIALVANTSKPEIRNVVPRVLELLQQRGIKPAVERRLAETLKLDESRCLPLDFDEICQHCKVVVSFGGDGTILSTARAMGHACVPILGVKIGGMGFLAEMTPDEFIEHIDDVLEERYEVLERMVLRADLDGENDSSIFALNDFVLDKGAVSRTNRIKIDIDDEFLNSYIGDGIIISTATGSTAYSLAAGGPILLPSMQTITITPINPHSLGARPVVVPGDKVLKIEIEFSPHTVLLSADGQVARELTPGTIVRVSRARHPARLVSFGQRNFYDLLRSKLHWGDDVRKKE